VKHSLGESTLLHVSNRRDWRAWLKKHHGSETEVWLVYFKSHSGKTRIAYNDAVEEALCFGWIDSTGTRLDEDRFAQRFSVRNTKTRYSQANKERLRELVKLGKVSQTVIAALGNILDEPFEIPSDILRAIKANPKAWKHFQELSAPYIRIRIAFIDGARKRPEAFQKRLRYFIAMTEKNRRFGFGGIEKYY